MFLAKPIFAGTCVLLFLMPGALSEAGEPATVRLFADGTLGGWIEEQHVFFKKKHPGATTWSVADGIVRCDGSKGNCGFLRYEEKLCDFTLGLEYRMSKHCNSGVGIRARVPYTTLKPNTLPSNVGLEVQIMDDANAPASVQSSGSFYNVRAPHRSAAKPAGEWNTLFIECVGPHIRVVLNGQVVQDVDCNSDEKLKSRPKCGYLSLQNHGHDTEFRNLELTVLGGEGQ